MSREFDPIDTDSQEREKVDREIRGKLARENEESDLKWLMGNKRGRRILWRLLDQSGVFRLSFNPNAMQMAFAEGNRNFGNRTLTMIHTQCPELYPIMVKEQQHGRSDDSSTHNDQ